MTDSELLTGRPYGGTPILREKSLDFKVVPIIINSPRMCGIKLNNDNVNILMFSVYMPCDTDHDRENINEYNTQIKFCKIACYMESMKL